MRTTRSSLKFFHSALLATLVLFAAARLNATQLIVNGGFETGNFTGWTAIGSGLVNGTDFGIAPHSGSFQAELSLGTLTQSVATTPGASYTIDFWLANAAGIPANAFTVLWGGLTIFSLSLQTPFPYSEHTFTETASTASTTLEFDYSQPAGGPWFLDDVSVSSVAAGVPDSGTTASLFGFSLAGLAFLRRKLS